MKRNMPMIVIGIIMLVFVGCSVCAIFEREGDADWSIEPAGEVAQL